MIGRKRDYHDEYDERYARRVARERRDGPFLWFHVGVGAVVLAGFVLGVYGLGGQHMGEKMLKALVSPIGVVWLILLGQIYLGFLFRKPWPAFAGLLMWLVLTVAGNQLTKRALVRSLERPYLTTKIHELGKFDLIIVLGGGTSVTPAGDPQLGSAGDRVMVAARIYSAGNADRVIVTGQQNFRTDKLDLEPGEEAQRLLIEIGVPADKTIVIKGMNTSQEILALKDWLANQSFAAQPRIGIITSAWHMNRAIDLARNNGLDAVAVPANFATGPFVPDTSLIVPAGENLQWTATVLYEHIGRWLNR